MGTRVRTAMLFSGALLTGGLAAAGMITAINKGAQSFSGLWPKGATPVMEQTAKDVTVSDVPNDLAPRTPEPRPQDAVPTSSAVAATISPSTASSEDSRNLQNEEPAPRSAGPRLLTIEPFRRSIAPSYGLSASADAPSEITAPVPDKFPVFPAVPSKTFRATSSSSNSLGNSSGVPSGSTPVPSNTIAMAPSSEPKAMPLATTVKAAPPAPVAPVSSITKTAPPVPVTTEAPGNSLTPPSSANAMKAFAMQPKQPEPPPQEIQSVGKPIMVAAKTQVDGTLGSTADPVTMDPTATVKRAVAMELRAADKDDGKDEPFQLIPVGLSSALPCGETLRPDLVGEVSGVIWPQHKNAPVYQLLFVDLGAAAQEKPSCETDQLSGQASGSQMVALEKNYLWDAKLALTEGDWVAAFLVQGGDANAATLLSEKELKNLAANQNLTYLVTFKYEKYEKSKGPPKPAK